jgi:Ni,Fe-hydrogenase III large subunit
MKRPIIVFLLIGIHSVLVSQSNKYEPIDKLGWEMTNFTIPDKLAETDTGDVNYLLTLNDDGKVKAVKILHNTFSTKTEKSLRRMVRKLEFISTDEKAALKKHQGTLSITREPYNPPPKIDSL